MTNANTEVSVALIAAAAAALAAWIAGAFSLLGLLISKEQEISGFRQAWIDALRADIAVLVAHAHEILGFVARPGTWTYAEFWNATREDYVDLNKASIRIKLRINPSESDSKLILKSMSQLEDLFGRLTTTPLDKSLEELRKIVDALERDAPPLLKREWGRVKKGEVIYQVARWLALVIFVITGILVALLFWKILR